MYLHTGKYTDAYMYIYIYTYVCTVKTAGTSLMMTLRVSACALVGLCGLAVGSSPSFYSEALRASGPQRFGFGGVGFRVRGWG